MRPKELPAALCWALGTSERVGGRRGLRGLLPGVECRGGPQASVTLLVVSFLGHTYPRSLAPSPHILLPPGLVTADRESADHILSRKGNGNLLTIVIGGAREVLDARPGDYTLLLRNRKGFIRLALTHGYGTSRDSTLGSVGGWQGLHFGGTITKTNTDSTATGRFLAHLQ